MNVAYILNRFYVRPNKEKKTVNLLMIWENGNLSNSYRLKLVIVL